MPGLLHIRLQERWWWPKCLKMCLSVCLKEEPLIIGPRQMTSTQCVVWLLRNKELREQWIKRTLEKRRCRETKMHFSNRTTHGSCLSALLEWNPASLKKLYFKWTFFQVAKANSLHDHDIPLLCCFAFLVWARYMNLTILYISFTSFITIYKML